jgi:hypothetical protein
LICRHLSLVFILPLLCLCLSGEVCLPTI